ncbi:MAG: hypothetical protein JNM76_02460 [Betaproteobacteria bacterium]|nr:hypothetical protein [Betaproteobacteria bacterium]
MKLNQGIVAALLLAAGAASANGLAPPLIFDKPQYFTNEVVQLTVKGQGLCKNIEVNWGDGQKDVIAQWDFGPVVGNKNLQATHKYADAKTFFPVVKTILGPSQAEQCGSHSGNVKVVWPGKVAKVSATPNPVETGKSVDIVIDGAGVCPGKANIRVTPPSGGAAQVLGAELAADAPWPRKASFTPTEVGTWIIAHALAPGQGIAATAGCFSLPAGSDGKLVVVAKPAPAGAPAAGGVNSPAGVAQPDRLSIPAGVVNPPPSFSIKSPPACGVPTINSLSGNLGNSAPLGISGCGFGPSVGDVLVKGTFNNQPNQTVKLLVNSWNDAAIQVSLPADVTGAPDQMLALQVVTPGGVKSVDKSVNLVAKRVSVMLLMTELQQASTPSVGTYEKHVSTGSSSYGSGVCGATVCLDRKLLPVPPFGITGTDKFRLPLKNGWYAKSVKLTMADSGADFNLVGTTTGPVPWLSNASGPDLIGADVHWGVLGPLGWIRYKLVMEIEGPKGVPYL